MDFMELARATRTCRRFDASRELAPGTLSWLVDCARISASGGNLQPLRYLTVQSQAVRAALYPALMWAGYLKEWDGPVESERPTGYIVVLTAAKEEGKHGHMTYTDFGIAAQTMQLAARSRGLGTCIFFSFRDKALREAVAVPEGMDILSVLAVGVPVEEARLVPLPGDGSVKYYRDDKGVHYVPKRDLKDVLLGEF